jgi:hypothetical protein
MHHVTSPRPASNSRPPNVQAIQLQPSPGQRESLFANAVSIHRGTTTVTIVGSSRIARRCRRAVNMAA